MYYFSIAFLLHLLYNGRTTPTALSSFERQNTIRPSTFRLLSLLNVHTRLLTQVPIFLYKWTSHSLNNCSYYISFRFTIILRCLRELSDLQSEIYSHRLTLNILVVPTSRTYFQNEFLVHCHFETQPFELLVCLIA